MNKISVLTLLLLLIFVGCKNRSLSSSDATESDIDDSLSNVGAIYDDEYDEVYDDDSLINAGWIKKYFTDEFGEDNPSLPFIEQGWDGQRNNHFDCRMLIRISDVCGLQFGIIEDYNMANIDGVTITAQFNGRKFQVPYDDVTNGTVTISDADVIMNFINILDSEGTLKLSFYREDAFDAPQNRVFTVYTPTGVKRALAGIGIEIGEGGGNYDSVDDASDEEDFFDPTTLDQETLMNRVIEE